MVEGLEEEVHQAECLASAPAVPAGATDQSEEVMEGMAVPKVTAARAEMEVMEETAGIAETAETAVRPMAAVFISPKAH